MAWAIDLDGVVRLGPDPIPGAADAVARLLAADQDLAFVTNNSSHTVDEVVGSLAEMGIDASDRVISSAMAVAELIDPGDRVLACAGPGVVEAVCARGAQVRDEGPVDVVVVGGHFDFDYQGMDRAARAVRGGARLLATNDDATYPTATGLAPGAGAILAGVSTAAGRDVEVVAGKPHRPMAELVRRRLGASGVMVGDRADTDGRFARAVGYRFALVLSGVVNADEVASLDPRPDEVADDLAALVARWARGVDA